MSLCLKAIHFKLYEKIKVQENLICNIAQSAIDNGFLKEAGEFVREPSPNLSAIIDLSNIHGWFQNKIADSEQRLAALITKIVNIDNKNIVLIEKTAEEFGKRYAIPKQVNAQDAYKMLVNTLINGMPCDNIEKITMFSSEKVVWQNTKDIHSPYWTVLNGNPSYYWLIRSAVIRGMCLDSSVKFCMYDNNLCEISYNSTRQN